MTERTFLLILAALGLYLPAIKATGHISWSWWWATSPLLVIVAYLALVVVAALCSSGGRG